MLIALFLTYCAFTLLCVAMPRHWQQLWPQQPSSKRQQQWLRLVGWLLLCTSAILCIYLKGPGNGLVWFCGLLSASVFILALLLVYAPRLALALTLLGPLLVRTR